MLSHGDEGFAQVGITQAYMHPSTPIETPLFEELPDFSAQPEVRSAHSLSRKALAPFAAATVQHLTSSRAAHSMSKSVFVFSFSVTGLKSPFHRAQASVRCKGGSNLALNYSYLNDAQEVMNIDEPVFFVKVFWLTPRGEEIPTQYLVV